MKRKKFGRYLLLFAVIVAALAWTACAGMDLSSLLHTHTYGDWETVQAATCTEDGAEVRTCACGEKETRSLAAKGHTMQRTVTPPTKIKDGYTTHACSICGYSYRDSSVPALGLTDSVGLIYRINEDGKTCTVVGMGTCTDSDIVIPGTDPDGHPVTTISYASFRGCTGIASVTIPDSVTDIGGSAFSDCTGLTSVTIPAGVTIIESSLFYGCTGLVSVSIPRGVTIISDSAFSGCTGLTSITIPDTVTIISGFAFTNCTSLTSVTIPDSVIHIGMSAFCGCTSLTSVIIPGSLSRLGEGAFYDCTALTSVTISDGVTSIGFAAFYNCSHLTSIAIPSSVTTIEDGVFINCARLTTITFSGTKAQWNNIKKYAYFTSDTNHCTIHCTDGDIVE